MYINFSDISGTQNLFLDFINEFENVRKFYLKNFRDFDQYHKHFKTLAGNPKPFSNQLVDAIEETYSNRSIANKTKKNLSNLRNNNCIAIVTGQQLGIFGGPMYTFYKIFTAIKLAEELNEQFDQFTFVPVFWLEGNDHDFEEISLVNLIDKDNNLKEFKYDDSFPPEKVRGSVDSIVFEKEIELIIKMMKDSFRSTEFTQDIFDEINRYYQSGKTIKAAFIDLMFSIFDEHGLILFDPQNESIQKLLKPIFIKEINNYKNHTKDIVERSAELEELYHAQVKVKPINLFMNFEGGRYLIEPNEESFRLKGKRVKFSKTELLEMIEETPQNFSPNVLLRPICQDYLLPTGFYIGGPGEISYFAQVMPLYELFDIISPIIYPRASLTLLEKSVKNAIMKNDIPFLDVFKGYEFNEKKILEEISEVNIKNEFENSTEAISSAFKNLEVKLRLIDTNLSSNLTKTEKKILQALEVLKNKTENATKLKNESTIRQLNRIFNSILPDGVLQERKLNHLFFVNKYGKEILNWIYNQMKIDKYEHQILEL